MVFTERWSFYYTCVHLEVVAEVVLTVLQQMVKRKGDVTWNIHHQPSQCNAWHSLHTSNGAMDKERGKNVSSSSSSIKGDRGWCIEWECAPQ